MTNLDDDFEAVTSDYWNPRDFKGRLHLVRPIRVDENGWGPGDSAVIAEVVVLAEKGEPVAVFTDAKVGGKAIQNQLKGILDRKTRLLGRLEFVTESGGKAVKYPYWAFAQDPSDQEKTMAREFLKSVTPF